MKSGRAIAVLLVGPSSSPHAVDRRSVHLSDSSVPESIQPFHAARGLLEKDDAKISSRQKIIKLVTKRSVDDLIKDYLDRDIRVHKAALVVGSVIDPDSIGNTHIRAHTLEGRLFRTVLESSIRARGITSSVILEREAYSKGAVALNRSQDELKRALTDLGQTLGSPWRADEKLAALAAWMIL